MYINFEKIYEEVARIHGISQGEVRSEIKKALMGAKRPNWTEGMLTDEIIEHLACSVLIEIE